MKKYLILIPLIFFVALVAFYFFVRYYKPKSIPLAIIEKYEIPEVESYVSIPISISMNKIEEVLKKKISHIHHNFRGDIPFSNYRNNIRVSKGKASNFFSIKGDIDLKLKQIRVSVVDQTIRAYIIYDINFLAQLDEKINTTLAQCGDEINKPQVVFNISSEFYLNTDGSIELKNKHWKISWKNPCKITFLNINAEELLNQKSIKEKFDAFIDDIIENEIPNSIEVNQVINKIWIDLQKPLLIETGIYLKINPKSIMLGKLISIDNTLKTVITAQCNPRFILNDSVVSSIPIALNFVDTLNYSDSLHAYIISRTPISKLNELLKEKLWSKKISTNNISIKIKEITAYQHYNFLIIKATLSEPFRGEIYLKGKPVFDSTCYCLSFHDFNYTIESEDMLAKLANWTINSSIIQSEIESHLKSETNKSIKKLFENYFEFDEKLKNGTLIKGSIKRISPINIFVSNNEIYMLSNVSGKLTVEVN